MATNKPTIDALVKMAGLIDQLQDGSDVVAKLKAYNKLLKFHIRAQKGQDPKYQKDDYEYNPEFETIKRTHNKEVIREY